MNLLQKVWNICVVSSATCWLPYDARNPSVNKHPEMAEWGALNITLPLICHLRCKVIRWWLAWLYTCRHLHWMMNILYIRSHWSERTTILSKLRSGSAFQMSSDDQCWLKLLKHLIMKAHAAQVCCRKGAGQAGKLLSIRIPSKAAFLDAYKHGAGSNLRGCRGSEDFSFVHCALYQKISKCIVIRHTKQWHKNKCSALI